MNSSNYDTSKIDARHIKIKDSSSTIIKGGKESERNNNGKNSKNME